jgi:protein-disulfide isomerase
MTRYRIALLLALFALLAWASAPAQFQQEMAKRSVLQPPKGVSVAIVVFEDLQCPDCARAKPIIAEAANAHDVPIVRHDFPLPIHNWAFDAALYARYFDTKSKKIGNEFRDYLYEHQQEITRENLRGLAEQFAASKNISLPFLIDPEGKLAARVKADYQMGQRIGISHTPTIYVVTRSSTAQPFVEVVDRSQLSEMIRQAKARAQASAPARPRPKKARTAQ